MIGRIKYYIEKFHKLKTENGEMHTIRFMTRFLLRRKFFLEFIYEGFEFYILSHFRDLGSTINKIYKRDSLGTFEKLMIYASFDKNSVIQPFVIEQLKGFYQCGYKIVFVSTSPEFTENDCSLISEYTNLVIHRKNIGYDFGSWKVGYDCVESELKNVKSLIIMNDSCLGPYCDLGPLVTRMQSAKNCVYGNSKSYEITEYIQSYFYHFGESVIEKNLHKKFFDRIRILNSKWCIVRFLEIGSSRMFKKQGIPLKALIDPVDPIIKREMDLSNRTEPMGDPLGKKWIELKLTPFYKRSNLL
jgi:hypothetical protein